MCIRYSLNIDHEIHNLKMSLSLLFIHAIATISLQSRVLSFLLWWFHAHHHSSIPDTHLLRKLKIAPAPYTSAHKWQISWSEAFTHTRTTRHIARDTEGRLLSSNNGRQKQWNNVFKALMENNCQPIIVYSANLTFRNCQEPREFTTNLTSPEKNLEEVLWEEGKWSSFG